MINFERKNIASFITFDM